MYNVMIIRKQNGKMSSEWLTDAEGFAVEFRGLAHAQMQVDLMRKSDPSIMDFIIE